MINTEHNSTQVNTNNIISSGSRYRHLPSTFNKIIYIIRQRPEIILLIILLLIVTARWFSFQVFGSNDGIYLTKPELKFYTYFSAWDERAGLGGNGVFGLGYDFPNTIGWIIAALTGNTSLALRVVWYWPTLLLAIPSMYLLSWRLFKSRFVSFGAALLYIVNTEFLSRASVGHIALMDPYVLAPGILLLILKSLDERRIFWSILASLLTTLALILELRTTIILLGVIILFLLIHFIKDSTHFIARCRFYIQLGVALVVPIVLLYQFSFLPSVLFEGPTLPSGYDNPSWLYALSSLKTSDALALFQSHWPITLSFDVFPTPFAFLIFPTLVFLTLSTRRKDKNIAFLAILGVLGVFLTKGTNPPLGEVNVWLFDNIPGFWGFRDPDKFHFLTCFSFSLLIPLGLEKIQLYTVNKLSKQRLTLRLLLLTTTQAVVLVIFVFMFKPIFFQEIGGTFDNFQLPAWQTDIEKSFEKDSNFYRVVWAPNKNSITPRSALHPSVELSSLTDYYSQTRPIADLRTVFNTNKWSFLDAPVLHQFFNILGFRYVYMPSDYGNNLAVLPPSDEILKDRLVVKTDLNTLGWLTPADTTKAIPSYFNSNAEGPFFATSKRIYFTGQDNLYTTLVTLPGFDLSKSATVSVDAGSDFHPIPNQVQLFNGTGYDDLALHFVPANYFSNLYNSLPRYNSSPNVWGHQEMVDGDSWSLIGQSRIKNSDFDYGRGFIFASKPGSLSTKIVTSQAGNFEVWVRSLDNNQGTNFELETTDKQKVDLQLSASSVDAFHWHRLGQLNLTKGSQTILLNSIEGFNAVNLVAFIPSNVVQAAVKQSEDLLDQSQIVELETFNQQDFKRIDINTIETNALWQIAKTGTYQLQLHLTSVTPKLGLLLNIDGQVIKLQPNSLKSQSSNDSDWYDLPSVHLDKGSHQVSVEIVGAANLTEKDNKILSPLDAVLLTYGNKSFSEILSNSVTTPEVSGEYINPYKFVAHVKNATQPFDLVFNTSYDPNWIAQVSGSYVRPEEAYSMIQTYRVNQLGSYDVTVEFRPQKYVYIGLILSGISLLLILLALYVFWQKKW